MQTDKGAPGAGYSERPLTSKLGIKAGSEVRVEGAPANYRELLGRLPDGVTFGDRLTAETDMVHLFSVSREELERKLQHYRYQIKPAAMVWVSWPKKASKAPTDITEDVVREIALPLGLVDVKVCAVDRTWAGLKLVIRKEFRK